MFFGGSFFALLYVLCVSFIRVCVFVFRCVCLVAFPCSATFSCHVSCVFLSISLTNVSLSIGLVLSRTSVCVSVSVSASLFWFGMFYMDMFTCVPCGCFMWLCNVAVPFSCVMLLFHAVVSMFLVCMSI